MGGPAAEVAAVATTVVAVYENIEGARQAVRMLRERGLVREVQVLERREDGPEQGEGPVLAAPNYGLSSPDRGAAEADPATEAGTAGAMGGEADQGGAGGGAALGALVGGAVGAAAAITLAGGLAHPLASILTGAGLGAWLGSAAEASLRDTDASGFPGTARLGGVLVVAVCADADAQACRQVLEAWGPLEVRVHPGGPVGAEAARQAALANQGGQGPLPDTAPWPAQVGGGLALTGGQEKGTEPPRRQAEVPPETQKGPGGGAGLG